MGTAELCQTGCFCNIFCKKQISFLFRMPSIGVKDVDQQTYTVALAAFLKKSGKVKLPEWVDLVKTNVAKELAPFDEDWYYIRSPVGVATVCKIYGVRRNNGSKPSHWSAGSGTIARKALQTLEQLKLVEKDPNGGRRLSSQGRRDLDRIAAQINAKK